MDKEEVKLQDAIDWENRILCRDGNCIGVVGANGRCKECGLLLDASQKSDDDFESDDVACDDNGDTFESVDDKDALIPDSDWENRTLCSDGNCIGVIGHDGCCRECGKEQDFVNNLSGAA